jgi:hypothetical protein
MVNRALLYGICLIGIGASGAHAQVRAQGPAETLVVDDTQKTPNTPAPVPEVISPQGARGDVIAPKTTEDPAAVLKPPNVDPHMRVEGPTAPGEERRLAEKRLEEKRPDEKKVDPK